MKTHTAVLSVAILLLSLLMVAPLQTRALEEPPPSGTAPLPVGALGVPVAFTASPYSDEFVLTGTENHGAHFYHPSDKDGSFGTKTAIPGPLAVDGLAVADFDGDGDLDFVLCQGETGNVFLYTNDGAGTFTPTQIASGVTPAFCSQYRVADFNRNGRLDFVGGDYWGPKWWFRNDGGGTFTKIALDTSWTTRAIFAVDAGNFNNDGNPDIIMASRYGGAASGKVRLYLGDGAGGFSHSQVIDLYADVGSPDPGGLAAGDFNADGNLDIVIGGDGTGTINLADRGAFWLYKGDGAGGFSLVGKVFNVKGTGTGEAGADAFDIDHDGKMDVVAYNWNGGQLLFIKGNGDGTFQAPVAVASGLGSGIGIAAPFVMPAPSSVGGTVIEPSPMTGVLALLPWVFMAVVAVGAGAYAMRRRYASPILARIR